MTIKGIIKLVKKPKSFLKDYAKKNPKLAKKYIQKLNNIDIPTNKIHLFIYRELYKEGKIGSAEQALKKAIEIKSSSEYLYELAKLLKNKKQWWQSVEEYQKAISLSKNPPLLLYKEYASVLTEMNNFVEASNIWQKILIDKNSQDWFEFAHVSKLANRQEIYKTAFNKAIEYDNELNSKKYGIGIFYEKKGYWKEASIEYAKILEQNPLDADLLYRYAYSLAKIYNWTKAEEVYRSAISLKSENTDLYYQIGFVCERQKKYEKALEAYSYEAENREIHTPYLYYRLGYVLKKLGRYKDSSEAFMAMKKLYLFNTNSLIDTGNTIQEKQNSKYSLILNNNIKTIISFTQEHLQEDTTRTDLWYNLAKDYSIIEDYPNAEYAYIRLIERKDNFDGNLYFDLGRILAIQGKYEEATSLFQEQYVSHDAHGMSETILSKDMGLKKVVYYSEYYEHLKLEERTILYESYHGSSISCNPYAIFKALFKDIRFKDYKHIWIINDTTKIPIELKKYINVIFIKKNSDGYMRYLAKAKYLINNTTFPDWFIRKKGQIYLNTWHGTPIKTLGTDVKEDFMAHKNQTRNFLQTSHIISPNNYTTSILYNSYDIIDIYDGIMSETGYPRQDLMLNITKEEKEIIYEILDIDKSKKVVLYAPTWRGSVDGAFFDTEKLINEMTQLQQIENITILFRGHYMVEKILSELNLDIIVVPSSIDTNSLLSIVDILITDYSSICFDFMAMERPIIYYVYDRVEYERERGLYFPLEELGSSICYTLDELEIEVKKYLQFPTISTIQKKAQKKYCSYDDGDATQRVIDLIFFSDKNNSSAVKDKKESILFYGGPLMANGITTSFINLINHIDKTKYSVTIVIDYKSILSDSLRMEQFNKIDKSIKVIARVGRMLMGLEERDAIMRFNKIKKFESTELLNIYEYSHKREFLRVFGHSKFDYIVNFEGYTVFWSTLMGMKNNYVKTNTIYQHNDMHGEWRMKYPYLENTFNLYHFYDKIASVSKRTQEHNMNNLSNLFTLPKEKFIYVDNIQDIESIINKSKEEIDPKDKKIFKNSKVFLNIARLSPEKGHLKLIKAFSIVSKKYSNIKLINLGIGVQKNEINSYIKKMKLNKKVFYLGHKSNPYSYLKKSDCFILASDHEGQPMTLLEALILNKPIIATDIVGNRSVLEGKSGHLVENSVNGLVLAMEDFLNGNYKYDDIFDAVNYNRNALEMFYEKILN